MIDRDLLDSSVLEVLKQAHPGKGMRPKGICALQIVARLPEAISTPLIDEGGIGGKGHGRPGKLSATQQVQRAAIRLSAKGLVKYDYFDARDAAFRVRDQWIQPGYVVATFYRYSGPLGPRPKGWHVVSIKSDVVTLVHSDVLNGIAVTASIAGSPPTALPSDHMTPARHQMPELLSRVDVFIGNQKVHDSADLPDHFDMSDET